MVVSSMKGLQQWLLSTLIISELVQICTQNDLHGHGELNWRNRRSHRYTHLEVDSRCRERGSQELSEKPFKHSSHIVRYIKPRHRLPQQLVSH